MSIETLINAIKHWAMNTFATPSDVKAVKIDVEADFETVKSDVEATIKGNAPDWEAAEGAPGHIKNRPFYAGQGHVPVADVLDIEFTATAVDDGFGNTVYQADISQYFNGVQRLVMSLGDSSQLAEAPKLYSIDGAEYNVAVSDYNDMGVMYSRCYGNAALRKQGEADTGEPLYLSVYSPSDYYNQVSVYVADDKPHTFSIYTKGEVVKQLDAMFLPPLVGRSGEADGAEVFNGLDASRASGEYSHAEGDGTAQGAYSHAEGYDTEASGEASHVEGREGVAAGRASHAEGDHTEASGDNAHAEGQRTSATKACAHAEGWQSVADGYYAHVEGMQTRAMSDAQHVQGMYNIADAEGKYAHIVGNGTADSPTGRSNAHTLDWDGNAWYAGTVEGTALILKSPDGSRYQVTVGNDGTISATKL